MDTLTLPQKQHRSSKTDSEIPTQTTPVFADLLHKQQYDEPLQKDNTYVGDIERMALFYLLSGNRELYGKHRYIYDFKEHGIKNCIQHGEADFSSGIKSLIRLGFNLYNGYTDDLISPNQLFYPLDESNRILALKAIDIRYISGLPETSTYRKEASRGRDQF
jgi:hypothetical protein